MNRRVSSTGQRKIDRALASGFIADNGFVGVGDWLASKHADRPRKLRRRVRQRSVAGGVR
jgi:hypothetical protein